MVNINLCSPANYSCSCSKLREEIVLREEMFHELKENKETEISNMKQIKRELEQRIASLLDENGKLHNIVRAVTL